jgi:preprotein translocase subunit SecA
MLDIVGPRIGDQLTLQPYPERQQAHLNSLDQALLSALERVRLWFTGTRERNKTTIRKIEALGPRLRAMNDRDLRAYAEGLRPRLLRRGRAGPVDEAFALVREVTGRKLGMRHFPVQLMGGLVLVDGGLAEMQTGEGKTLVALLPAITVALSGLPVHVVTVNDYLAKRDAETLRPVYEALGLSLGLVQAGQAPDVRKAAYACDVTYCTNKELVFDYLRDRIAHRKHADAAVTAGGLPIGQSRPDFLLRGLHFCIVDEADSVLIDEARTPLIISAEKGAASDGERYAVALDIARSLACDQHYQIKSEDNQIQLTRNGQNLLANQISRFPGVWRSTRAREELVRQALTALHLFHKDKHYIVASGKVQIVDEYTGRVMEDRTWERGLHQLIELKEGCILSDQRESLAQITYQRFFRRYMRLSGMTGTALEVAGELRAVYGLRTYKIPTNKPERRRNLGHKLHHSAPEKWRSVVAASEREAATGRPVLIGTRSVAASEIISAALTERGTAHVVLNARQDSAEAETIAQAGQASRITVATNMAGRGTDILLGPEIADRGGLHVILTEYHESGRIDRQLIGREARQGDPGTYEAITSLEDEVFTRFAPLMTHWLRAIFKRRIPSAVGFLLKRMAQRAAENYNGRIRRQIVRRDQDLDRAFAFTGRPD